MPRLIYLWKSLYLCLLLYLSIKLNVIIQKKIYHIFYLFLFIINIYSYLSECESTFWGENCEKECVCNGRGASKCHPIKGCLCESGWFGDSCDDDINECEFEINPCNNPRKTCVNTFGSYRCDCLPGFILTDQGLCSGKSASSLSSSGIIFEISSSPLQTTITKISHNYSYAFIFLRYL